MKATLIRAISVTSALLFISLAPTAHAFSVREMLGLGEKDQTVAAETKPAAAAPAAETHEWAKPSGTGGEASLDLTQIQAVLANLAPNQRQALLADPKTFQRLVQEEADNQSILAAARANNIDKDSNTAFLMQRSAETVMREVYVSRLIATKVPPDFPTDAQVKDYYDKNKDKMVLGERYHVWQIFLPISDSKDDKAIAALQKQADSIASDISQGKMDFGAAAEKYSAHEPSRHNGGYMGLLPVAQLRPEISKVLLSLAEGEVSKPIRTDAGLHIVKHGAKVAAEQLSLAEATPEIRQLLTNQARSQLRQAIYEQARKSYPVQVPDNKIEEWRLRMKTNLESAAPATAPAGKRPADKKP